jgi:Fe-S-cluster-containing dehydrogenase component
MTGDRQCVFCAESVPAERAESPYCTPSCTKRARRRRTNRRAFERRAKAPRSIEAVAAHFGISVHEARRRAEHDIEAGQLVGWRDRAGQLIEISSIRASARSTQVAR